MLDTLFTTSGLLSLVTLVLMEIVLGIDNIIFIAILCGFLPAKDQAKARTIGLSLALVMRILLLFCITWMINLQKVDEQTGKLISPPIFTISSFEVRVRDIIFFLGGVFLIYKTVKEIYHKLRGQSDGLKVKERKLSLMQAIIQITLIDIVFSFDSILTAVGLSNNLLIMVVAVTVSMFVMLFFAKYVSDFINRYPTIKMLALVFLVGIGVILMLESIHVEVDKGYIYTALAFSLIVELLNIRFRRIKHQSL